MNSVQTTLKSLQDAAVRRSPHLWAALAIAAIALAFNTVLDFGNLWGVDEWAQHYVVSQGSPNFGNNRPFDLAPWVVTNTLFGAHYLTNYVLHAAAKIAVAIMVYLLTLTLKPGDPRFAFGVSAVYLTHTVEDWFFAFTYFQLGAMGDLLVVLVALYLFFHPTQHPLLRIAAILLAVFEVLTYEAFIPALLGVPMIVLVLRKEFNRRAIFWLLAWTAAILLTSSRYIIPLLGLGTVTYGSATYQSLAGIVPNTLTQFRFAFYKTPLLESRHIYEYRFSVALVAATIVAAQILLRFRLAEEDLNLPRSWFSYGLWLLVGVVITWLSFAAFLPTLWGKYILRVHWVSAIGEAIVLTSLIWLVSWLFRAASYRWVVQSLGLVLIAAGGTAQMARLQTEIHSGLYGIFGPSTWEAQGAFLRSLAHEAPVVKPHTLLVHVENTDLIPGPFVKGYEFQYAIRYFFGEGVTGIQFASRLGREEGNSHIGIAVHVQEGGIGTIPDGTRSGFESDFYSWDEVIVIMRDSSGQIVIAEELPEVLGVATPENYDPYARIERGYIPERIQSFFPPISIDLCALPQSAASPLCAE